MSVTLRNCQFAIILHWYILLCFISQFSFKNLFNCVFVYVFLHFKSSKTFFLHFKSFEFVSSQLHLSLHFISILFAKFMKKGILVISCIQIHFSPWKLFESFQLVWISLCFDPMLKSISKITFESFWVSLAPRGILAISYVKISFNLWKIVHESFQLVWMNFC